jgi:hypothetical protein
MLASGLLVISGRWCEYTGPDGRLVRIRSHPRLEVPSRWLLQAELAPDDIVSISSPAPGVLVLRLEEEADERPSLGPPTNPLF